MREEPNVSMNVDVSRLRLFSDSPPAGKGCLCSLCNCVITVGEMPIRLWPKSDTMKEYRLHWGCFLKMQTYKTLERQIQDLWASRGIEVIREEYHGNPDGTETWIITGKRNKAQK